MRLAWRRKGRQLQQAEWKCPGGGRLTLGREGLLWSQAPCFCAGRKWGPWERIGAGQGSQSDWERPLELGACDGGVATCFPAVLDFGPYPSLQDSHESFQALLTTPQTGATLSQPWAWGLEMEVQ